jgi:hypothetical protein
MTKAELLKELEPFDDGQYVYVSLHSDAHPEGRQVIIQGVRRTKPWHDGKPDLVGLVAHDRNKGLTMKVKPTTLRDGARPECVFSLYRDDNGHWFVSAECRREGGGLSLFSTATYDNPQEAMAEALDEAWRLT